MKLVTYNMRYSLGRDERFDLPRIAHAIQGADVVALQEVERFWPRSGMADQPAELGALLPDYYWVYGPAFDVDGSVGNSDGTVLNRRRQFGTMLMSKSPIVSSRLYVLPKIATVDRFNMDMGALEGVVETGAGPVRVYSLHLSHLTSRERTAQINTLLDIHRGALLGGGAWCGNGTSSGRDWTAGEPMPPMPGDAILMGDFNCEPTGAEYELLVGPWDPDAGRVAYQDGFVDSWVAAGNGATEAVTWALPAGSDEEKRLDYCFVGASLAQRVRRAWTDLEAQGSDHYPYWVEIDL